MLLLHAKAQSGADNHGLLVLKWNPSQLATPLNAKQRQPLLTSSRKTKTNGTKTTLFQTSGLIMTFLTPKAIMWMLLLHAKALQHVDNHGLLAHKWIQFLDQLAILSNAKKELLHQRLLHHYGWLITNQKKEKKRSNWKIGSQMKMKLIVIDTWTWMSTRIIKWFKHNLI